MNESGSEKNNNADLHASRMATFNMILDPLVYIFFRRENLEWLFRFIRKKRGKSGKPSEESSSASAKTDETNRSATNLEKIQPEFSEAATTWFTLCVHPNVVKSREIHSEHRFYHVMWICPVYPETSREKNNNSGQSAAWDRKGIPGDTRLSEQWHSSPILRVLRPNYVLLQSDSHFSEWYLILQLKTYRDFIISNTSIICCKNAGCLLYVYQWNTFLLINKRLLL